MVKMFTSWKKIDNKVDYISSYILLACFLIFLLPNMATQLVAVAATILVIMVMIRSANKLSSASSTVSVTLSILDICLIISACVYFASELNLPLHLGDLIVLLICAIRISINIWMIKYFDTVDRDDGFTGVDAPF